MEYAREHMKTEENLSDVIKKIKILRSYLDNV